MKGSNFLNQPASRCAKVSILLFLILCLCGLSNAGIYSLTNIGSSSGSNPQFTVDVQNYSTSQILLVFANNVVPFSVEGSVRNIYVEQSPLAFNSFIGLQEGTIEFSSQTGKLPGGESYGFTNADFCAAADPAAPKKGLNPGESVGLLFDLNGALYSAIDSAIGSGSLRVGIHVISMKPGEFGELPVTGGSFIIPEPLTLTLLGFGGLGIKLFRRKK